MTNYQNLIGQIMDIKDLYVNQQMSIVEIHNLTKIPKSNIQYFLKKLGVLRSRAEGILIAQSKHKLGSGFRGKKGFLQSSTKKILQLQNLN